MNDLKKRWNRGETLIETLIAVLILTFSSIMFLNMTLSSVKINSASQQKDAEFREDLMEAEKEETGRIGKITIKTDQSSYSYQVEYYGKGNDGMISYHTIS